jgi:hypothetical protein
MHPALMRREVGARRAAQHFVDLWNDAPSLAILINRLDEQLVRAAVDCLPRGRDDAPSEQAHWPSPAITFEPIQASGESLTCITVLNGAGRLRASVAKHGST